MSLYEEPISQYLASLTVEEARKAQAISVKFSVWHWFTMFDAKVCDACESYYGDEYELEDPKDLELMFPYGYFENEFTFRPMIHPNDRCKIERTRDYDFNSLLIHY